MGYAGAASGDESSQGCAANPIVHVSGQGHLGGPDEALPAQEERRGARGTRDTAAAAHHTCAVVPLGQCLEGLPGRLSLPDAPHW